MMIIYCTKETLTQYKRITPASKGNSPEFLMINSMVIKNESNDPLLEWGCDTFTVDNWKCLQIINYASGLTIFLFNFPVDAIEYIGNSIATYIIEIFKDDKTMKPLLEKFFAKYPITIFEKLVDKSVKLMLADSEKKYIASNWFHSYFNQENGIFRTKDLNRELNIYAAPIFAEFLRNRMV